MKKAKTLLAFVLAAGISGSVSAQTFGWSRLSGSTSALAVAADWNGNSYVLNYNQLEKRNSGGTLTWSKQINVVGTVMDATCDYLGNIYLTGYYYSDVHQTTATQNGGADQGFNLTGCTSITLPGYVVPDGNLIGSKLFFVKADPNGNMLWQKTFSNVTDYTSGLGLTTDAAGNVYLMGVGSNQMNFGGGTIFTTTFGQFVAKFNSAGTYIYANNVRDNSISATLATNNDIAVNINQELVVTGEYSGSITLNPNGTPFSLTSLGSTDAYIARYNASGVFQWAKQIGGAGADVSCGALIDNSGNAYMYGLFSGMIDINTSQGVQNKTASGTNDMFIISLTPTSTFRWGNAFGGTGAESPFAATQTDFDLHVTGGFTGTVDFNPGGSTNSLTSAGGIDMFTAGYALLGGTYTYCYSNGSTGADLAKDICSIPVSSNTTFFQVGTFEGTVNFHPTSGWGYLTATSTSKAFEVKTTAPALSGRLANPNNQAEVAIINSVYPNPFATTVHLSFASDEQTYNVSVYSIDGRLVYSTSISGVKETDLDLPGLNSGIYLLNIESEGKTEQHKLIKE